MNFSELNFLFLFLPCLLVLYGIVSILPEGKDPEKRLAAGHRKARCQNIILAVFSLIFYLAPSFGPLVSQWLHHQPVVFRPQLLVAPILLMAYLVITYLAGLGLSGAANKRLRAAMQGQKVGRTFGEVFLLCLTLLLLILPLVYFKLFAALPLAISFYTFTSVSYLVDIYRGGLYESNFFDFACYFLFFPKLLQGPITRYHEIQPPLQYRRIDFAKIEHGVGLFILGLSFKVLLASKIGALWRTVWSAGPYGYGALAVWFGAWGYSMQLYFDFWGYSLMAMGLAQLLGFTLPVNFDHPYAAKSFTSFWRKWHMTLGKWFRDYVYIPLGGSKKGAFRLILSLFVTWALTGFWHGAKPNFILWGLTFFVLLVLEKFLYGKFLEKTHVLGHLYVLLLLPLTWMIFAVSDPKLLLAYFKRLLFLPLILTDATGAPLALFDAMTPLTGFMGLVKQFWWLMLICILFCTPYPMRLYERFKESWVVRILLLILFWVSVWQVVRSGSNPFMYLAF